MTLGHYLPGAILGASAAALLSASAFAHDPEATRADAHAPIGVMGDHTHAAGEWMFSYRFMHMAMDGNRIGTSSVDPDTIVTTTPNRFGPPATLRVVPLRMDMDMHMLGAMYAPTDRITLMAMVNYLETEMKHVTYAGMMGTNTLGEFSTRSEGFGDTRVSALIALSQGRNRVHGELGVSLPTGSIDETDTVLTPMNTRPELTLPYPMQLGSGTYDPILGLTWTSDPVPHWRFGAQGRTILRIHDNDQDYRLGNEATLNAWTSWSPAPAWSMSLRAEAKVTGSVEGRDVRIAAPVQTANPDFSGGERISAYAGLNWVGQRGVLAGHRLAVEAGAPVYQDLNGPQMEQDWTVTIGWQYAFGGR